MRFSPEAPTAGLSVFVVVLRLKRLLLVCPLCLCGENTSSVAVLHRSHRALWVSFIPHRSPVAPLHRSCMIPVRASTTSCSNVTHCDPQIGHPIGPFLALQPFPTL
jgi:hypothetical protein